MAGMHIPPGRFPPSLLPIVSSKRFGKYDSISLLETQESALILTRGNHSGHPRFDPRQPPCFDLRALYCRGIRSTGFMNLVL